MGSSITLDPHPIIKEAGVMEHATSNAAQLCRDTASTGAYCIPGVNEVFAPEVTGHNG